MTTDKHDLAVHADGPDRDLQYWWSVISGLLDVPRDHEVRVKGRNEDDRRKARRRRSRRRTS
jgi:hypothetical protein